VTALDGDAVAHLEPGLTVGVLRGRRGGLGSHRGDDASRFVPQYKRIDDLEVTVRPVKVVVYWPGRGDRRDITGEQMTGKLVMRHENG
jgi:hypothetical protein